jgi:hypothetical protein
MVAVCGRVITTQGRLWQSGRFIVWENHNMITINQLDTVAQSNLRVFKGWKYTRDPQGDTIYYAVTETRMNKFIGTYYVRIWTDGTIRAGWTGDGDESNEIEQLRDMFNLQIMAPLLIDLQKTKSSSPPQGLLNHSLEVSSIKLNHTSGLVQPGFTSRNEQEARAIEIANASHNLLSSQGITSISIPPWEQIPDKLWYRKALQMWHEGLSVPQIGARLNIPNQTIYNRLAELRNQYGETIVPKRK